MDKSEAGRLGGLATFKKHGSDHMQKIGRKGAKAFYKKYIVQPYGTNLWAIVDRQTNQIVKIRKS